MRKLPFVLATLAFLGFLLAGAPALEAQTHACYDVLSCTENSSGFLCEFDASCSTYSSLWRYQWVFGDGSSAVLTGQDTVSHQYVTPTNQCLSYDVRLTVVPYSGAHSVAECEIVIVYCGPGPAIRDWHCEA